MKTIQKNSTHYMQDEIPPKIDEALKLLALWTIEKYHINRKKDNTEEIQNKLLSIKNQIN